MFDLFWLSTSDDRVVENADWVEIKTLFHSDGTVSREDLARALYRAAYEEEPSASDELAEEDADHTHYRAETYSEQRAREMAEDVFRELEDRERSCAGAPDSSPNSYPFELIEDSVILRRKQTYRHNQTAGILYLFLLAITRANMSSTQRTLAGLDPTKLFERLCADVLLHFWGGKSEHSDVMVFGTAQTTGGQHGFRGNIDQLCRHLCEGSGWKSGARSPRAGDGKLDLVVWRRFQDVRHGGLVGFAQCKTGVHWRNHLADLQPRSFCTIYMHEPLLIDPVRIYMVPCRISHRRWAADTSLAGILFDRCRIVQYGASISRQIIADCRTWLNAALDQQASE